MAGMKLFRRQPKPDPAEILERVAYRLTHQFTTTASFRARGVLLPWEAEALNLVIRLQREAQQ